MRARKSRDEQPRAEARLLGEDRRVSLAVPRYSAHLLPTQVICATHFAKTKWAQVASILPSILSHCQNAAAHTRKKRQGCDITRVDAPRGHARRLCPFGAAPPLGRPVGGEARGACDHALATRRARATTATAASVAITLVRVGVRVRLRVRVRVRVRITGLGLGVGVGVGVGLGLG